MHVGGCLFLITIVASSSSFLTGEYLEAKDREKRHILPLLGFLQGYKIGQNFALQLPPYVLSPILVLPSINQQQSVNIQGTSTDDNYDESGGTVQIISPAKLVLEDHNKTQNNVNDETTGEFGNECEKDMSERDTFRQNTISSSNSTLEATSAKEENTVGTTESTESTTEPGNIEVNVTTVEMGPYPTAIYKNEVVNTITFTESPIDHNLVLPSFENNWQNFCSQNNTDINNNIEENIESRSDGSWNNEIMFPTKPSYGYKKYPYSPSNNNVENLYVTNSYNPEGHDVQYSNNDRWQTFSSSGKHQLTSQFRPLAGLYYDGYLHQAPDKHTGFVPYHNNYYYKK